MKSNHLKNLKKCQMNLNQIPQKKLPQPKPKLVDKNKNAYKMKKSKKIKKFKKNKKMKR